MLRVAPPVYRLDIDWECWNTVFLFYGSVCTSPDSSCFLPGMFMAQLSFESFLPQEVGAVPVRLHPANKDTQY